MSDVPTSKLGEELPLFCRRCGGVLYGLPSVECEQCSLPHLHCPQCGHDELAYPLRPAFAPLANRAAATGLAFWVACKIAFFVAIFCAWFSMGNNWAYRHHVLGLGDLFHPLEISLQAMLIFGIAGFGFGGLGRLLLLRWAKGVWVGLVLTMLVDGLLICGGVSNLMDIQRDIDANIGHPQYTFLSARWSQGMLLTLLWTDAMIITAATIARPACLAMVRLFTPRRWSDAICRWDRAWTQPEVKVNAT